MGLNKRAIFKNFSGYGQANVFINGSWLDNPYALINKTEIYSRGQDIKLYAGCEAWNPEHPCFISINGTKVDNPESSAASGIFRSCSDFTITADSTWFNGSGGTILTNCRIYITTLGGSWSYTHDGSIVPNN